MLNQFRIFLGPVRLRALFLLFTVTGLFSLILNALAIEVDSKIAAQSVLLVIFLAGAAILIGGRMSREQRLRWVALLAPIIGLVVLTLLLPHLWLPFMGAAAGWMIAGLFVFRSRVPKAYQEAIRHMRRSDYAEAVKEMDALIREDRETADYYRLRAEIFRLWGKLDRARKDYHTMIELLPDEAVGYNGLAEVYLQSGEHQKAHEAALKAYELAPEEWVAAYNLGMIEDRLHLAEAAEEHLNDALRHQIPDSRHRLLIHLYLLRAYMRLDNFAAAETQLAAMRRQQSGLEEWEHLLGYDQAAALRAVLADDVALAAALLDGKVTLEAVE